MHKIGLTGGIGSGKSTVATILKSHGFTIIDADQIARDVVPTALPALIDAFGPEILAGDNSLNRAELARLAFATPALTEKLNSIMHPLIREETTRRFTEAEKAGHQAVIYDMPLLVDQGLHKDMDMVIVVAADPETRVKRLLQRGLTEADARKRMAAQISDEERNEAADVLIGNNGAIEDLIPQVAALAERIHNA